MQVEDKDTQNNECVDIPDRPNRPQRSQTQTNDGNGFLKCYYCEKAGNPFQTNSKEEYHKHGIRKHPNKSLYPNMATIEKHSLKPQGREWEV